MDGQAWLHNMLLDLGDIERFRQEISTYQERAVRLRQPIYLFLDPLQAAMLATMEGRFAAAERLAREAHTVGKRLRVETAAGMFAMQMFLVRWLQGRLAELAPAVERFLAVSPTSSLWRPGLAIVLLEMGREAEARAEVERLTAGGSADVAFDVLWISSIAFLSEVAARAGAREAAETLYRLLLPRAGGTVTYGGTFGCLGSARHFLGQLAASLERRDEAEQHYEAALKANTRLGARPWVALSQERLARLLLERGTPTDLARAEALLEQALDTARELGMHGLVRRLGAAQRPEPIPDEPASPSELSRREIEVLLQIATGKSNREIAAELGISLSTVATHLRNILAKTGARNRTEAAAFAHRRGLS
jgi:DNA-binding CsgD family transcriptional regulator